MRQKTASALDFLIVPGKTTAAYYEALAKEAADEYFDQDALPASSIAKIASEKGLNKEQVTRVVELTNHEINARLSTDNDDQTFTFPTTHLADVYGVMGTPAEKTAEDYAREGEAIVDFGIYDRLNMVPDYVDVIASQKFQQKLSSVEKEAEEPETLDIPEVAFNNHVAYRLKKAEADFEYAQLVLRESLSRLRSEWEKLGSSEDRGEFLSASCCVFGDEGSSILAKSLGETAEKTASTIDAESLSGVSEYLDEEHSLVKLMKEVYTMSKEALTKKEEMNKIAGVASQIAEKARSAGRLSVLAGRGLKKHMIQRPAEMYKRTAGKGTVIGKLKKMRSEGKNPLFHTIGGQVALGTAGAVAINKLTTGRAQPGKALASGAKAPIEFRKHRYGMYTKPGAETTRQLS